MGDKIDVQAARRGGGRADRCPAPTAPSGAPRRPSPRPTRIGYPVLVKASAGGGGKGMRIAARRRGAARGVRPRVAARRSAAFGDGRRVRRALRRAPAPHRGAGARATRTATSCISASANARSSAATRRSSRSAPSPFVDADMRRAMGETAVGAGPRGRLRVRRHRGVHRRRRRRLLLPRDEHAAPGRASGDRAGDRHRPRRRAGPDRGRRAAGLRPGRRSAWTATRSSAASTPRTPDAGFVPATGRLQLVRFPTGAGHPRRPRGRRGPATISAAFDPMIAKLVVHGADARRGDRARAARRCARPCCSGR